MDALVGAHPELVEACQELEALGARTNKAPNSVRAYSSVCKKFRTWCDLMELPALPSTPEVVLLYIGHLRSEETHPSRVRQVRYGIAWMHDEHGYPSPVAHPRVVEAFKAYDRWWASSGLSQGVTRAHPLSADEVIRMIEVLPTLSVHVRGLAPRDREAGRALLRNMLKAELLTAWQLGRRLDEIVRAELDWLIDDGSDLIHFRSTSQKGKADGFGNTLQRTRDPRLCAVTALRKWIEVSAPYRFGEQHLFGRIEASDQHPIQLVPSTVKRAGRARGSVPFADFLSETNQRAFDEADAMVSGIHEHRQRLVTWMRAAGVEAMGSDRRLGGHSMRRGIVTELHKAGADHLEIASHIGFVDTDLVTAYSDYKPNVHPIDRLRL